MVSSETFNLLKSPWAFKQYGESGQWVSELFPHVAEFVDDLCFIKSMHASNSRHGAALLELHTGSDTFVRPSIGSWLTYGLGSENQDMPGFITVCPTQGHGGANNYGSAFLPAPYAGTAIGTSRIQAKDAKIPFITNDQVPRDIQRKHLDFIREMNQQQLTPDRTRPKSGRANPGLRTGLPDAGSGSRLAGPLPGVRRHPEAPTAWTTG